MKNRNYLVVGTLLAVVLGIIFVRLTAENSMVPSEYFSDLGSVLHLLFCLSLFYIIAFSDFNQVSSLRLTKYKLRWLIDMSIYLGFRNIFIQNLSQKPFPLIVSDFHMHRNFPCKFNDTVIQKGYPGFQANPHACTVHFNQNIIWKVTYHI